MTTHYFYLARCADGSLYAGTCIDPGAREDMHNAGKGAKYTRSRRPVVFVYTEECTNLSAARKREAQVKKWRKSTKEKLAAGKNRTRAISSPRRRRYRFPQPAALEE